jgi:hypothetical protein
VLVYGDRSHAADPQTLLRAIRRHVDAATSAAGLARTDLVTRALLLAGELAQGVADAEAEASGVDDLTPAGIATMRLATAIAARLLAAVGQPAPAPPEPTATLAAVAALPLPPRIRCTTPEGHAFYAIYPEAYAAAAAVRWPSPPLVIGIRSIGTGLAATAAARLGAEALTVRPVGHPLRRELALAARLRERLRRHDGFFLVVDEGPGLSGSSFGAVADTLEALGVALPRIVFAPSHPADLGPHASPAHRERWTRARRLVAGGPSGEAVAGWFADVVGPIARIENLSGGGWRRDLPEHARPPAAPVGERLKVRLTGAEGRFVARFAGLGATGEEKLAAARRLHAAGFTPEPMALRRGFLLERWVEGGPPGAADPDMLAHLGRYLGFRARALPACGDGADPAELRHMAVHNAAALGGPELGGRVAARLAAVERLAAVVPVRIDGRLHRWEWLRTADGRLCKTDALDHAAAHDLVGCQDIAWDVAGATVELGLSDPAAEALRRAVADGAGRAVGAEAVAAFRLCYAAFQGGLWRMTGEENAGTERQIRRYLAELRRVAGTTEAPERSPAAPVA